MCNQHASTYMHSPTNIAWRNFDFDRRIQEVCATCFLALKSRVQTTTDVIELPWCAHFCFDWWPFATGMTMRSRLAYLHLTYLKTSGTSRNSHWGGQIFMHPWPGMMHAPVGRVCVAEWIRWEFQKNVGHSEYNRVEWEGEQRCESFEWRLRHPWWCGDDMWTVYACAYLRDGALW